MAAPAGKRYREDRKWERRGQWHAKCFFPSEEFSQANVDSNTTWAIHRLANKKLVPEKDEIGEEMSYL